MPRRLMFLIILIILVAGLANMADRPAKAASPGRNVRIASTPPVQQSAAIAFDGTNYLVALENRDVDIQTQDIYAVRVTPSGTVLDPAGIPISTETGNEALPAVAFDGTNYLIAWSDRRSGMTYDIYAARVTPSGTVLDPAGIPISTETGAQTQPAVAFDGTNYLVSWDDERSGAFDVYAARVTPNGTVLDPAGIPISTAANMQGASALAFDGTNYLVTWADYRADPNTSDTYGARVTPGGTVLDPAGIPISTGELSQQNSAVAFDGTNYLPVWLDDGLSVYGARVTPGGTVLDPNGIGISTETATLAPTLAFDGTNYLVTWADFRSGTADIYAARVTPSGTVLDPAESRFRRRRTTSNLRRSPSTERTTLPSGTTGVRFPTSTHMAPASRQAGAFLTRAGF